MSDPQSQATAQRKADEEKRKREREQRRRQEGESQADYKQRRRTETSRYLETREQTARRQAAEDAFHKKETYVDESGQKRTTHTGSRFSSQYTAEGRDALTEQAFAQYRESKQPKVEAQTTTPTAPDTRSQSQKNFDARVEERQRLMGTGEYGKGKSKDIRPNAAREAEARVQAERQIVSERQEAVRQATGGLTAGQRDPITGKRILSATGKRPTSPTKEEIEARAEAILGRPLTKKTPKTETQTFGTSIVGGTGAGNPYLPGTVEYLKYQLAEGKKEQAPRTYSFQIAPTIDPYAEGQYEVEYSDSGIPIGVSPKKGSGLKGAYTKPYAVGDQYSFEYVAGKGEEEKVLGVGYSIELTQEQAQALNYKAFQRAIGEGGAIDKKRIEGEAVELLQGGDLSFIPPSTSKVEQSKVINTNYAVFKANQIVSAAEQGKVSAFGLTDYDVGLLVGAGNKPSDVGEIRGIGEKITATKKENREAKIRYFNEIRAARANIRSYGYESVAVKDAEGNIVGYEAGKPLPNTTQYVSLDYTSQAYGKKTEAGTKIAVSKTDKSGKVIAEYQPFALTIDKPTSKIPGHEFVKGFADVPESLKRTVTGEKEIYTLSSDLTNLLPTAEEAKLGRRIHLSESYQTRGKESRERLAQAFERNPERFVGQLGGEITVGFIGGEIIGPGVKVGQYVLKGVRTGAKISKGEAFVKFEGPKIGEVRGSYVKNPKTGKVEFKQTELKSIGARDFLATLTRINKTGGFTSTPVKLIPPKLKVIQPKAVETPPAEFVGGKPGTLDYLDFGPKQPTKRVTPSKESSKDTSSSFKQQAKDARESLGFEPRPSEVGAPSSIDDTIRAQTAGFHRTPKGIKRVIDEAALDRDLQLKAKKTEQILSKPRQKLREIQQKIDEKQAEINRKDEEITNLTGKELDDTGKKGLEDATKERASLQEKLDSLLVQKNEVSGKINRIIERRKITRSNFLGAVQKTYKTKIEKEGKNRLSLSRLKITKFSAPGFRLEKPKISAEQRRTKELFKDVPGMQRTIQLEKQRRRARLEEDKEAGPLGFLKRKRRTPATYTNEELVNLAYRESELIKKDETATTKENLTKQIDEVFKIYETKKKKPRLIGIEEEYGIVGGQDYVPTREKQKQRGGTLYRLEEPTIFKPKGLEFIASAPAIEFTPSKPGRTPRFSPPPTKPALDTAVVQGNLFKEVTGLKTIEQQGLKFTNLEGLKFNQRNLLTTTPIQPTLKISRIPAIPPLFGGGGGASSALKLSDDYGISLKEYDVQNILFPSLSIRKGDVSKGLDLADFGGSAFFSGSSFLGKPRKHGRKKKGGNPFGDMFT